MSIRIPPRQPTVRSAAPTGSGSSLPQVTLKPGAKGPAVQQVQDALVRLGYLKAEDQKTGPGLYGPKTKAALEAFQKAKGLTADGLYGPKTRGALEKALAGKQGPAPQPGPRPGPVGAITLPPVGASERERFNHYANIVRANGGEVNPGGKPTVLGIRGMSLDGSVHGTSFRGDSKGFDDMFVVLTPDGRVNEIRGATHPGQSRSTQSPDVNRDGVGDVGMIRPGNFMVVPNGQHRGAASFHVRTMEGSGNIPGWRDTNHSGTLSEAERSTSASRGHTLSAILFHQGGTGPLSIGCQTMSPAEYSRFLTAVGGPRASFSYSLVDANGVR